MDTGDAVGQVRGILARLPDDVWGRLLLAVPLVVMVIVAGLNFRPIGDEAIFLHAIEGFAAQWPRPVVANYLAAPGPLSLLLLTAIGKVVGFELWKLRFAAILVTYVTANLFYDLARRHKLPYPLLSTFVFLFFPYTFFHGFTIYTNSFAAMFGVWALRYYLSDEPDAVQYMKGGLMAALAILCRQTYLFLPAGMLLYEVARSIPRVAEVLRQRFPSLLALGLPFALVLPLFLIWGGITPPSHQSSKPVFFSGGRVNFVLIFIGFYFLPMLVSARTAILLRTRRIALLAVVVLLPLIILSPPVFDEVDQVGAVTGLIMHGLDIISSSVTFSARFAAMFALWLSGLAIVLGEIVDLPWGDLRGKIITLLGVYLVMIAFTPSTTERYFMDTMPLLILLMHRDFHRRGLLVLWLFFLMALSVGFAFWQIELKSFHLFGQPPGA